MYRELLRQTEGGDEVLGKIHLVDGELVYEDIPEGLQQEMAVWGVQIKGVRYTSKSDPVQLFNALPLMFLQGRIRVSQIKEK